MTTANINVIEAAQFPFQDQDWIKKIAIAGVLVIVPILGWVALAGYVVRVIRGVLQGSQQLPEFDDFGGDFSRGVMLFVGGLLYSIPTIFLSFINGIFDNFVLSCIISLMSFTYSIAITPILYTAYARYAMTEDFNAFLDFGGLINTVTTHTSEAAILVLNVLALGLIGGVIISIGLIACCLPGFAAIGAFAIIGAVLTAQWAIAVGISGGSTPPRTPQNQPPQGPIEPLG
ncbi:MAG: DUF4013 domain-containing protein [Anaerolineales bacterium]